MAYVPSLGGGANINVNLVATAHGPYGPTKMTPPPPPKAPPPPPKLEPQACYPRDEHEALVARCRGLAGLGEFTSGYYKAVTKKFACAEAEKPICVKAPPKKPGMRVDLTARAPVAPPRVPPKKPGIAVRRNPETDSPSYVTVPSSEAVFAPAPEEEQGISTGTLVVGAIGVALVGGVLYMVFR